MINVVAINGVNDKGTVQVVSCDHNGIIRYNPDGNCNLLHYIEFDDLYKFNFLFDHRKSQQINNKILQGANLFINQISDPDSHSTSLTKSINIYHMTKEKTPWINNPEKIVNTKRDTVFTLLHNETSLIVPKTIRVNKWSTEDLYKKITSEDMKFPVLIRPVGSHGGDGLETINSKDDIQKIAISHGQDIYISEFVDYKNKQGIYKKYRLVVVCGKVFIRHVIYSNHWKIHSSSRSFMYDNKDYCDLEEKELGSFDEKLRPKIQNAIDAIHKKIGLDYFGIDCAIENNKLIIFEVNANMNILVNNQKKPNIWDRYINKISAEVVDVITRKVT